MNDPRKERCDKAELLLTGAMSLKELDRLYGPRDAKEAIVSGVRALLTAYQTLRGENAELEIKALQFEAKALQFEARDWVTTLTAVIKEDLSSPDVREEALAALYELKQHLNGERRKTKAAALIAVVRNAVENDPLFSPKRKSSYREMVGMIARRLDGLHEFEGVLRESIARLKNRVATSTNSRPRWPADRTLSHQN